MLAVNFAFIMIAFRFWGKTGLFIWMPVSVIVANIQVTKTVVLFGLEATLGNIIYATSFLATDILAEFYSRKDASKAVRCGLFSLVAMTILMQMALLFKPSVNDFVSESLNTVFGLMPRIAIASLVAYVVSNYHDIWSFLHWKEKTGGRFLWLRNNASTMVSQLIDSVIFTLGAFLFTLPGRAMIEIIITTYLLKFITAACDTAMIYLAKKWVETGKIKDLKAHTERIA